MKGFLLFFVLGFLSNFIHAQQPFNRAYHNKSESATSCLLNVFNDYYFVSTGVEASQFGKPYLYRYSNNGLLKSRDSILGWSTFGYYEPKVALKTLDNKLLLVGGENECDVQWPTMKNFICKLDTNSNVLFMNTSTEIYGDNYKNVLQYPDSTFFAFTDSLMYHYGKGGQFIIRKNLGLTSISAVKLLQNGILLLSAKSGSTPAFVEMNATGTILNVIPSMHVYQKIVGYGLNNFIANWNGNLFKYSSAYNLLSTISLFGATTVQDFTISSDTIYAIGPDEYAVCDTSLNVLSSSICTTQRVTQTAISKKKNLVSVLSSCVSKNSPSFPGDHHSVTLNVFDKLGSNNFLYDIAILSVKVDTAWGTPIAAPLITGGYTTYATNVWLKAKVCIKNTGASSLYSFKLNCYEGPNVACGAYYYMEKFNISALAPGDSISVTTSLIHKYVLFGYQVSDIVPVTFCLFSTVPNDACDKTFSDNELCKIVNLRVTVGLKEQTKSVIQLTVAPNPSDGRFRISCEEQIETMQFFDGTGRLVFEKKPLNKHVEIDLTALPTGLYFLRTTSEQGTALTKVIKE